jgi:hypothetical protein
MIGVRVTRHLLSLAKRGSLRILMERSFLVRMGMLALRKIWRRRARGGRKGPW